MYGPFLPNCQLPSKASSTRTEERAAAEADVENASKCRSASISRTALVFTAFRKACSQSVCGVKGPLTARYILSGTARTSLRFAPALLPRGTIPMSIPHLIPWCDQCSKQGGIHPGSRRRILETAHETHARMHESWSCMKTKILMKTTRGHRWAAVG